MGCHFLLQGINPTQGSNSSLASPVLTGRFFNTEPPGKAPVNPKFIQMFAASQQVFWSKISTGPQQSMANPRRIKISGDLAGCPVVKTPYFHCKGRGFNPWSGNSDPVCHMAQAKKRKDKISNKFIQVSKQAFASNVFWPLVPLPFLLPYFLTFPWWFQHAWDRTWAQAIISATVLWRRGGQALRALLLELAYQQRHSYGLTGFFKIIKFFEKEMATHSSILAWKIPWTEEPGGLQSMGSQWVGHDWATSLDCTLQLVGSQFLDQGLNLGHGSERLES